MCRLTSGEWLVSVGNDGIGGASGVDWDPVGLNFMHALMFCIWCISKPILFFLSRCQHMTCVED